MTTATHAAPRHTTWPAMVFGVLGGLAAIALGIIVLAWPTATLVVLAIAFGIQLMVLGVTRLVLVLREDSERGGLYRAAAIGFALLTVVAGVICVLHPFTSLRVLIIVTAIGWLLDGIGVMVAGREAPSGSPRTAMIVMGIVSIVAAIVLIARPGLALVSLVLLGGWVLIGLGVVQIIGVVVRRRPDENARVAY